MSLPPSPGPQYPGPSGGPAKRRKVVPWGRGGVAPVVVAAAVVVPIVLTDGDDAAAAAPDAAGANSVADKVVGAFNARDVDALAGTACADVSALDRRKARQSMNKLDPAQDPDASEMVKQIKVSFERSGDARVSGGTASSAIRVVFSNVPPTAQALMPTVTLHVELKDSNGWCVTDIKSQTERPSPSSR